MKSNEKIILIDADVISHFIYAGEIITLPTIFKTKIYILDKVYAELERFPNRKKEVDNILRFKLFELMDFPEDNLEIKMEYTLLKKGLKGEGESACMAIARFTGDILASSNLKDTAEYCKRHHINYLTTMDFLCRAYKKEIFSLERCNEFIAKVLKSRNRLPVTRMQDYRCREIEFIL